MNPTAEAFCNASGIDPNERAKTVFVWRAKGSDDYVLLGSGQVVQALGRPPGIQIGQYSITFPLPHGCSADEVVITDDTSGRAHLPSLLLRSCSAVAELKFGRRVPFGDRAQPAIADNASPEIQPSSDNAQAEIQP